MTDHATPGQAHFPLDTHIDAVNLCDNREIQELFVRGIFQGADFRNSMMNTLAQFGEPPSGFEEFYNRLKTVVEQIYRSGVAETHPEVADEIRRFQEYVEGLEESYNLLAATTSTDAIKKYTWPDPNKGKRFGGSIYETIPAAENTGLITKDTKIASAGGCLNFRFVDVLTKRGYTYLHKELNFDERTGTMTGNYDPEVGPRHQGSCNWGIVFNSAGFAQLADMAFADPPPDQICVQNKIDPPMFSNPFRFGVVYPSIAAFKANTEEHVKNTRAVFEEAEVFVAFLGNNTGSKYLPDGRFTPVILVQKEAQPLFRPHVFSLQENIDALCRFVDLLSEHNPSINIILGVTPTPMLMTPQLDRHVVESDYLSKSIMRVAAEEVVNKYENVHYFPSIEAARTCVAEPYGEEGRQPTEMALERMADTFEAKFCA